MAWHALKGVGISLIAPDQIDRRNPKSHERVGLPCDNGANPGTTGVTITFDDGAASLPSDSGQLVSGTFRPSNVGTADLFPAPAPAAPYASPATGGTATFGSTFTGINPNGTWSLHVTDDANADSGRIQFGWSLTITY